MWSGNKCNGNKQIKVFGVGSIEDGEALKFQLQLQLT